MGSKGGVGGSFGFCVGDLLLWKKKKKGILTHEYLSFKVLYCKDGRSKEFKL